MKWNHCTAKGSTVMFLGLFVYLSMKSIIYLDSASTTKDNVSGLDDGFSHTRKDKLKNLVIEGEEKIKFIHSSISVKPNSSTKLENQEIIHSNAESNFACRNKTLNILPKSVQKLCNDKSCRQLTCQNLLFSKEGNSVYKIAKTWMEKEHNQPLILSNQDFVKRAHNCSRFRSELGYANVTGGVEEASFPIAYNMIIHKDLYQVEQLLRAIYRPQNIYCLHVDGKSPKDFLNAAKAIVSCFSNVFIASKRERVVYAGFSRLQADINCMADLVNSGHKWKYLINLAGLAFPLKSNLEIVRILKVYNGANDVEGIYGRRIITSRFESQWVEMNITSKNPSIKKSGKRNPPPPDDIEIVRGSAYGVFCRKFVQFLLVDSKAKHLLEWSKHTYSPDEHYWATLHHTYTNPHVKAPGAYAGIPNKKPWLAVFVAWGGVNKCHGKWVRGTCVFGVEDLPQLINRRELFANKFYLKYQPLALECLHSWIDYKTQCPTDVNFNVTYYESLPFIIK